MAVTLSFDVDVFAPNTNDNADTIEYLQSTSNNVLRWMRDSTNNTGMQILMEVLGHFEDVVFGPTVYEGFGPGERNRLCPGMIQYTKKKLFNPEMSFTKIKNIAWRKCERRTVAGKTVVMSGRVFFDVIGPRGMPPRNFVREFNNVFEYYTENMIDWAGELYRIGPSSMDMV